MTAEHSKRWQSQPSGALTKKFGRQPNNKEAKELLGMNRKSLKSVVDIPTGHCSLQKHLHTLGIVDTPLCPSCGDEEEESVEHYLCRCEAFRQVRNKYLGKSYLRYREISTLHSSDISNYIKASKRFDAVN